MPQVGFERKMPVFERVKTCYALGRAASMIGPPVATVQSDVAVLHITSER
jgi:hypothetical protein